MVKFKAGNIQKCLETPMNRGLYKLSIELNYGKGTFCLTNGLKLYRF
jgi:hypothetical protein